MAMTTSVLQSSCMVNCFSKKCLRRAIAFEVEKGYRNVLSKKLRFHNFLSSGISKLFSRFKHKSVETLLEEVDNYDRQSIYGRSKLLNKVSAFMGYGSLDDLIANERVQKELLGGSKSATNSFDVSLACKQFPSITLGRSPSIKLYDGTTSCFLNDGLLVDHVYKGFLPSSIKIKGAITDPLCEAWPSLLPEIPGINFTSLREDNSCTSSVCSQPVPLETELKEDIQSVVDEASIGTGSKGPKNQDSPSSVELILDKPISSVSQLTKKQCHQLENCGFYTLRKLLHHFPRTYADLKNAHFGIDDGQYLIFMGKILSSRGIKASHSFSFLEVVVRCELAESESNSECTSYETDSGSKRVVYLHLKKFFRGSRFTYQPFLRSLQENHREGDVVCVSGKVKTMSLKDHYEMREYNIDVLDDDEDCSFKAMGRPYPIYPSKGRLGPNFLKEIISRALRTLFVNVDPIPRDVTLDFGLLHLNDAYIGIHQPKDLKEADLARRRLIFDEFFYLQLGRLFQMVEDVGAKIEKDRLLEKFSKPELTVLLVEEWSNLTKKFLKSLPYSLTSSQLTAVSEIIWDIKQPVPMNRLLQGDVGCGKTVVGFLACMEVIGSGYQAAFMVPTELLASQHYEHLLSLLEKMEEIDCKPSVALLTGSTPSKHSRLIRKGIQAGDISMVIGTHRLISENIEFSALRIAVIDEQHRFGVMQRGRFNSKLYCNSANPKMASTNIEGAMEGEMVMAPHVLTMSATPIPRTLALALYGDMSLTHITDLPPGRLPVETQVVEGNETGLRKVYQMMQDELETGGKIYLVYPVIEQSEQLPQLHAASADLETISSRFEGYSCGLLHGKMKSCEKDEALRRFRSGETHILLATQVIEVGVDVPDASMMVVMNAERFGIAQLHQLRGRVGRGVRKSKCVLLGSTVSSLSRLKVLEESSDGFYLANVDLLLRGPGDLLGKKQSGHLPEFPVARLEIDGNILQEAHLAALKILGISHDLEEFPNLKAELSMRQPLCLLGD